MEEKKNNKEADDKSCQEWINTVKMMEPEARKELIVKIIQNEKDFSVLKVFKDVLEKNLMKDQENRETSSSSDRTNK